MANASIAHEFHKIRDKWKTVEKDDWDMLIWLSEYQDIDIIDKFMQIEQSPIGVFDDIFFRFETKFSNPENFEKELWEEYLSWFQKVEDPKYDILGALEIYGFLPDGYKPDESLDRTAENLWLEFTRFRNELNLIEENFIIYFPVGIHKRGLGSWFIKQLKDGLPEKIRFVSMDISQDRKFLSVKTKNKYVVKELVVKLNMLEAINNELDKGGNANKNAPSTIFSKQVKKVIDTAVKNDESLLKIEIDKMFSISDKIMNKEITATSLFVAANSYYTIFKHEKSLEYVDKVIETSSNKDNGKTAEITYPLWRSAIILKALLLLGMEKKKEAIKAYSMLVDRATEAKDVYFIMDGYRLISSIYLEDGHYSEAWDNSLLSIQAGSYLPEDIRRQSTYIISANTAYSIAEKNKKEEDIKILKECFEQCIGKDWKKVLKNLQLQKNITN